MSYLGEKQQSEAIRFHLTTDTAPTGTPQVAVEKQGSSILAATNMTQGASTLEWYYDYTTGAGATIGAYQVKFSVVLDGVTRYAYDEYDIMLNDADDIKTETALVKTETDKIPTVLTNQSNIETKVDTVDTVVDSIQVDTNSIETKVDTVDTVVDLIKPETDKIQTVDDNVDQLLIDVAAVPTAAEIDTELTTSHGSGNWTTGTSGTGANSIIFNIKDGSANNINLCKVQVHNTADDDSPLLADVETDANGNTTTVLLDDATYSVRLSKGGAIVSEVETVVVSGSATHNLTVVAQTVSNPTDPDVCRLRMYVADLDNTDSTDISSDIEIWSYTALTKVNGIFIKNTKMTFTYDNSTTPDSYYFDAVRGAVVHITNKHTGANHPNITVPAQATVDLETLLG